MRDSIVFYRSFFEAICTLPDEEQLKAYRYIVEYGLYGNKPEGNTASYGMFLMAKPQIDANNRRFQNGTKGGRPKTEPEPDTNQTITEEKPKYNQAITEPEPNENVNVKENDRKEISPIGDTKKSAKRFMPPSEEELEAYCREKSLSLDIERFIDFYASKGWMVGKNKMKDWKAAVRNWSRNQRQGVTAEGGQRQGKTAAPNRFKNFKEHDCDYDALMKQAILKQREDLKG